MHRVSAIVKWMGAIGSMALVAGCMVPPIEAGSPVVRDYRAEKINDVPPLPDYRSDYRPAAGTGWTSGWDRTSPQRSETARDYYLIDAADGLAQAIGDAPPDFAFRFDGRDAWIWQSNEGEAMIVEPSPYGVIQYYYAPRAAAPYLVRDVYQSYAFEGPDFVASYGQDGRLDQRVPSPRTLDSADRLQARGRAIMAASYQRRWDDSVAASWSVQTFSGFGFGDSYGSGIGRGWSGGWQPRWREHRDWGLERELRRERDARRRLEEEARDRADNAERFRQWRREGRRGSAPTMRRGRNPGGDSFVQPVTPPVIQPEPGAGPIMAPGGGGTGRPRPGTDRPRPGMVPPVTAQPAPPTVQPAPVPAGPEVPRVARRPRPEPGVQAQPGAVSETPLLVPANDDLLREQRDAEAAARAAQIAIEAERGRERTIHLEAERMAREEEERERAERAAAAAANNAIAAEQARQLEDADRQRAMAAAQEAVAAAASEQRSREAEQAQAEAQERAAARAEAQERAEERAAAAAARAAAAAEAAAEAAEERQRARSSDVSEDENVRPD